MVHHPRLKRWVTLREAFFRFHFAMRAKTLLVSISIEIYTALSRDGLYFSSVLIFQHDFMLKIFLRLTLAGLCSFKGSTFDESDDSDDQMLEVSPFEIDSK